MASICLSTWIPSVNYSAWTTKLMEATGCLDQLVVWGCNRLPPEATGFLPRQPVVSGGNRLSPQATGCLGRQPVVWGGNYRDLSGSNRRPAASLASGGNYSDLSATSLAYLLLPNLTYLMTASWKSVLLLFWWHLNCDSSQYFYSLVE